MSNKQTLTITRRVRPNNNGNAMFPRRHKGTYTGEVENGLPHGKGKCVWDKGTDYGTWYEGDWVDGKMQGKGTFYSDEYVAHYGDKWTYTGDFVNDLFEGHGVMTWDTLSFEGEWKQDLQHGCGVYRWANGSVQKGTWVEGVLQGEVSYYDAERGTLFEGAYVDGRPHGYGVKTWDNGDFYRGEWKDGYYFGTGVRKDAFGTWEGAFEWNKIKGFGIWASERGYVYTGTWNESFRGGKGTLVFPNGDVYEGEVHLEYGSHIDGMTMHGKGVYTYANGTVYTGGFKYNRRQDEVDAERAAAAAVREAERQKAAEEYRQKKKRERDKRRANLTAEDAALRLRLEETCKALYGDETDIRKRYEILQRAYFVTHHSGANDSLAWENSTNPDSAAVVFWQTARDLAWEVKTLCGYYELELEE